MAEKVDIYCSIDLNNMKKMKVTKNEGVPEDRMTDT